MNEKTYFLYARKSSESEDRQVQSIDDQLNRLKGLADELGLNIKATFTEAKSAKQPNQRLAFNEMLERIESGEANGILCWQINRLSRNPIDSARIQWLSQQGVLHSIQTIDREYLPEDNVLLLSVESGIANQYVLDLSKNVKRGIQSKLEKGWYPHTPRIGYLNGQGDEDPIVSDPDRFVLVRKMFDLMLTGAYTPPRVLQIASNDWGLRTRKQKRQGGRELANSAIYKMFTDPFYYGEFEYPRGSGRWYQGKHKPMITHEEYDKIQLLLGRDGRPRPQQHLFAFTGLIRCAECGCLCTAETKKKLIKSTGKVA